LCHQTQDQYEYVSMSDHLTSSAGLGLDQSQMSKIKQNLPIKKSISGVRPKIVNQLSNMPLDASMRSEVTKMHNGIQTNTEYSYGTAEKMVEGTVGSASVSQDPSSF
jgi:hypothetical protein